MLVLVLALVLVLYQVRMVRCGHPPVRLPLHPLPPRWWQVVVVVAHLLDLLEMTLTAILQR